MPYLTLERKQELTNPGAKLHHAGDVNYLVTEECLDLLQEGTAAAGHAWHQAVDDILDAYTEYHGDSYATYNAVIGALTCCSLEWQRRHHGSTDGAVLTVAAMIDAKAREFYREVVAPYEDLKIKQNGDVYP